MATLALIFAISGTAIAAKRYVITSTKQIKPGAKPAARQGRTAPRAVR
jgi:hypothetical protein